MNKKEFASKLSDEELAEKVNVLTSNFFETSEEDDPEGHENALVELNVFLNEQIFRSLKNMHRIAKKFKQ